MNIVCYTAVIGGYDNVVDPTKLSNGVDFICFTDKPFASKVWRCLPIPSELEYLSDVKKQRIIKICPHRYLSQYDISIWIDGNIAVVGDLNDFIKQYNLETNTFFSRIHPSRNCIYKEANACKMMKKDVVDKIDEQIAKYQSEGYPKNAGMVETCILLRKHNARECKMIDNAWAIELLQYSHRDQLSFNYVCWRDNFLPGHLVNELKMNENKYFRMRMHQHAAR